MSETIKAFCTFFRVLIDDLMFFVYTPFFLAFITKHSALIFFLQWGIGDQGGLANEIPPSSNYPYKYLT